MQQSGLIHPITATTYDLMRIFESMGFSIASGPELEDPWHNFDALNVPADHPARDMQDTFWTDEDSSRVLRTHTSSVQIRFMETHKPPFKIIAPGRVYRNEATDATHEAQFHQIEGLVVGQGVSVAHMNGTLEKLIKELLGPDVEMRLRPGYFPFVEPGFEVDIKFRGKWMEVLGAGMVHPNVLRNGGIDPDIWSGFAFGMGIDRLVMLNYKVPDLRYLYNGDLRLHYSLEKPDNSS